MKKSFEFQVALPVREFGGSFEKTSEAIDKAREDAVDKLEWALPEETELHELMKKVPDEQIEFLEFDSGNPSHAAGYFGITIEYEGEKDYDTLFNQALEDIPA